MSLDRELLAIEAARGPVSAPSYRDGDARRHERPSLLVLRALGLGDLLTAVPALRGLARTFPDHRRVLAAPAALVPLLDLMRLPDGFPVVHELLDVRLLTPAALARATSAGSSPIRRLARTRARERLGAAVNLHGCGPQSHRLLLAAAPARMIAFANSHVPESLHGPRWREQEHEVTRWCRLLQESAIDCDPSELAIERPPAPLEAHGATVIHPGAASTARRWPARRWAAVAAAERIVGRRVLMTGSRAEAPLCRAVAQGAGLAPESVLAGRTNVAELAGVIGAAGRVLCGDTGVGHLATALGTPSVLLFGPVSPAQWGPPPEKGRRHRVLWAGATGKPHGARPDPGLLQIAVADVLDALEGLEGHG